MRETVDFISASPFVSLQQSLDELLCKLDCWLKDHGVGRERLVWARIFLSDPANQVALLRQSALYKEVLSFAAFSYVGQPLLSGAKAGLMFAIIADEPFEKTGDAQQMVVSLYGAKVFYHSVRLCSDEARGLGAEQQTELIFARHIQWLKQNGLTLKDNCVRTWLYVRDIDVNYKEVMKGRNAVFEREGLTKDSHFIASTGIGGYSECAEALVSIDFVSVEGLEPRPRFLNALDFLNPTHEYGVAFERGVLFGIASEQKVYISGTASIDKTGACIFLCDIEKQTERLFINISELLKTAGRTLDDARYFVVYLRDMADRDVLEAYMRNHFSAIPFAIVKADVCRPEWLVEVECATR